LRNDHPISMEIPDSTVDQQFSEIKSYANGQSARLTAGQVAYISRFGDSGLPADRRDALRAYPTISGKAYIECASCHNPHEASRPTNDGGSATDVNNSRFLRLPSWSTTDSYYTSVDAKAKAEGATAGILGDRNAGSLLCLSCHQK